MRQALPFPNIDPIALSLGPIVIRWYALAYLAGILFAWGYGRHLVLQKPLWGKVQPPLTPNQLIDFVFWAVIGVIIGGRLGYVLFYDILLSAGLNAKDGFSAIYAGSYYLQNPMDIPQIWQGGMSFHGGLFGLVAAMWFYARHIKSNFLSAIDLLALTTPFGLLFGRIANFINGELYGRVTDMPWGVIFPTGGPEPRHPSQLYEGLLEGLLLFVILRVVSHNLAGLRKPGLAAGIFGAGYGLSRILVETVREPDAHIGVLPYNLTMGMILSAPIALAGVLLIWNALRKHPTARAI
ncbi:prolipoprotein diacylglyceryl transferase [Maritalea porphyrae]|uniref:prolipoprotein diacylglyceryl transferase n=1 Tax=Maritalea porphyrae TaxID=880732 RepID=UPI0024E0885A|nr:prolipoprotein diacylglyceryl transferase [Maritalea porphyrae]